MAKKSRLPISKIVGAIDTRNKGFYSSLSDEEKKSFSNWIIMRYASSSSYAPEHYLLMVNSLVNVNFADLTKHPELQWKLIALCGIGKAHMHPWIPVAKKKKKDKITNELSKLYPTLKADELDLMVQIHTRDELENLFLDMGYQPKEVKELLK